AAAQRLPADGLGQLRAGDHHRHHHRSRRGTRSLPRRANGGGHVKSIILTMLAIAAAARADVTIVVDRNMCDNATPQFRFARVPPPSPDDAATTGKSDLIPGRIARTSPGLTAVNDGRAPADWDEPASNLFFAPGSWGGRFRIDLGSVIPVAQINSYSWHPDSRAAQLYKVYGSDASDPSFNPAPESQIDPAAAGWKLIAFV